MSELSAYFNYSISPMSISVFRQVAVFVFCLSISISYSNSPVSIETSDLKSMTDRIKEGIENVVHIVDPRLDPTVESYLRIYIDRNRTKTENMIGRSTMYFPMFEEELLAGGLPVDLKYLAVVESALTPHAISRVGATGLWQFMRPTAREMGLQITKYVDERCDPVLSTKAAINYLSYLHKQFNSWELAMAAYNAGPGRVRYAIRKSGSKDYWKLQGFLPKETRAYVPGFIAASYVLNYYQDHGLEPAILSSDLTQTATIKVFKNLDFSKVQQITGVAYDVIHALNPKYIRQFIPQSENGHDLVLPAHATTTMLAYLNEDGDVAQTADAGFIGIETGVEMEYVDRLVTHTLTVKAGDNLYNLAKKHDCTVDDLQRWNKLSGTMLRIGQQLKVQRMEKVLVRMDKPAIVAAPPVRRAIYVEPLSSDLSLPAPAARTIQYDRKTSPTPVLKSTPDLNGSSTILRRRMSAREMGVMPMQPGATILPGQRLN